MRRAMLFSLLVASACGAPPPEPPGRVVSRLRLATAGASIRAGSWVLEPGASAAPPSEPLDHRAWPCRGAIEPGDYEEARRAGAFPVEITHPSAQGTVHGLLAQAREPEPPPPAPTPDAPDSPEPDSPEPDSPEPDSPDSPEPDSEEATLESAAPEPESAP